MTTKQPGGKITGILALTCEGQEALNIGDPVHLVGDYEVVKADGTKPILGRISVKNVTRDIQTGAYGVGLVPGDVTVEARGFAVFSFPAGGALAAGVAVGVGPDQRLVAANGTNDLGILLTEAAAAGDQCDVLMR